MPLICVPWYTIKLLRQRPSWIFLFGDNAKRVGRGGQASVCRDERNARGIRTKWEPSNRPYAFFYDKDYKQCTEMIAEDFAGAREALRQGATVALPRAGLGTGHADLSERGPEIFRFLQVQIMHLIQEGAAQTYPPPVVIKPPVAKLIQEQANYDKDMMIWTVYQNVYEFPGRVIARPSSVRALAPMLECLVARDLLYLREQMPRGLQPMLRGPEDGPNVVETWVG